jgi:hypothetical protein
MKASNSTWTVLDNPKAVACILDYPESFLAFVGKQKSISQASKETHIKLNAMAYRVKRMEASGLVTCKYQKRNRRDIKVYTACAERLFIPLDLTPQQTLEALLERDSQNLERLINISIIKVKEQMRDQAHSKQWGIRLFIDEHGEVQGDLAFSPYQKLELESTDAPALVDIADVSFKLDFADAKKLQKELLELEKKYQNNAGSQNYIFRIALVPYLEV